jgi:4-hydroxybenzoate polyprenyltransferase
VRPTAALQLGRVQTLPAVLSGVLAASVLAGAAPATATLACAVIALTMMEVARGWLDDAFDRDLDRTERPAKPIPAGAAPAGLVFDVGFALLAGGVLLIAATSLATGAGWRPIVAAIALGSLIVFSVAGGRHHPLAPALLGLSRAGVYITAALLFRAQLRPELLLGVALVFAYVSGFHAAARQPDLEQLSTMWPLALIGLPFALLRPTETTTLAVYAGFLIWVVRGLALIRQGEPRRAVAVLTAGTALLDALILVSLGRPELAAAALAAFFAMLLLQRALPAP